MLVQLHAHLVNPSLDTDGGLDDMSSQHGRRERTACRRIGSLRSNDLPDPDRACPCHPVAVRTRGTGQLVRVADLRFHGLRVRGNDDYAPPLDN